jgi:hypothetical protein
MNPAQAATPLTALRRSPLFKPASGGNPSKQ